MLWDGQVVATRACPLFYSINFKINRDESSEIKMHRVKMKDSI